MHFQASLPLIFTYSILLPNFLPLHILSPSIIKMIFFLISLASAWDYSQQGRDWGGLCSAGGNQSPINIDSNISQTVTYPSQSYWFVSLSYSDTLALSPNSSHTPYGFNFNLGRNFNIIGDFGQILSSSTGATFAGRNASFHSPSEHQIDGVQYPLELQITHVSISGISVVLVVLYYESAYENMLITQMIKAFESDIGENINLRYAIDGWFALKDFYYYTGSMTQPPCTEGLIYVVYERVMPASTEQIQYISRYIQGNNRAVMPQNSRKVMYYQGLQDNVNAALGISVAGVFLTILFM